MKKKKNTSLTVVKTVIAALLSATLYFGVFRLVVVGWAPNFYLYLALLLLLTAAAVVGLKKLRLPWIVVVPGGCLLGYGVYWLAEELGSRANIMPHIMLVYVVAPVAVFSVLLFLAGVIVKTVSRNEKREKI